MLEKGNTLESKMEGLCMEETQGVNDTHADQSATVASRTGPAVALKRRRQMIRAMFAANGPYWNKGRMLSPQMCNPMMWSGINYGGEHPVPHTVNNPWAMAMYGAPSFMWGPNIGQAETGMKRKQEPKQQTDNEESCKKNLEKERENENESVEAADKKKQRLRKRQMMEIMTLHMVMNQYNRAHPHNVMWPAMPSGCPGLWRKMQHLHQKNQDCKTKNESDNKAKARVDECASNQKACNKRKQMLRSMAMNSGMLPSEMGFGPCMPPPPPDVQEFIRRQMQKARKNKAEHNVDNIGAKKTNSEMTDQTGQQEDEDPSEKEYRRWMRKFMPKNKSEKSSAEVNDKIQDEGGKDVNTEAADKKKMALRRRRMMQAISINQHMLAQGAYPANLMWSALASGSPGKWKKMQNLQKKNPNHNSSDDEAKKNVEVPTPDQQHKECNKQRKHKQMLRSMAMNSGMLPAEMGFGPCMPPPPPHVQEFVRRQMQKARKNKAEKNVDNIVGHENNEEIAVQTGQEKFGDVDPSEKEYRRWMRRSMPKDKPEKSSTEVNGRIQQDESSNDLNTEATEKKRMGLRRRRMLQAMSMNQHMLAQGAYPPNMMWSALASGFPERLGRKKQNLQMKNSHSSDQHSSDEEAVKNVEESNQDQQKQCVKQKNSHKRKQMLKYMAMNPGMLPGGMGFGPYLPPPHVQKQMLNVMGNKNGKKNDKSFGDNENEQRKPQDPDITTFDNSESVAVKKNQQNKREDLDVDMQRQCRQMRRAMAMNSNMWPYIMASNGPFVPPPPFVQNWMQ